MGSILCGVDIGGTKLSVALITTEGRIIDKCLDCDHIDKPERGLTGQIKSNIRLLLKRNNLTESDLRGIGIGCAGHIRFRDGTIITTSNLKGYKGYPLRSDIQSGFKVPVTLDNDANAQAFGELKFGAGKGYENMVFLTISSGIGAGIIIDKKVYRGMTGTAGEFGHTIIEPGSDLICTCGNKGCLMAVACGMALPHLYKKKLKEGKITKLNIPSDFDCSKIDGKLIKEGLDFGDQISKEIILDTGRYIGIGIYNIFQALNPQLIVLGGGLLSWGEIFLEKIKQTFYDLARDMMYDHVEIKVTEIGPDAGVIGAASLSLEIC